MTKELEFRNLHYSSNTIMHTHKNTLNIFACRAFSRYISYIRNFCINARLFNYYYQKKRKKFLFKFLIYIATFFLEHFKKKTFCFPFLIPIPCISPSLKRSLQPFFLLATGLFSVNRVPLCSICYSDTDKGGSQEDPVAREIMILFDATTGSGLPTLSHGQNTDSLSPAILIPCTRSTRIMNHFLLRFNHLMHP